MIEAQASTSRVTFTGPPKRRNGGELRTGQVLFEVRQQPLPPPVRPGDQTHGQIPVRDRGFADWFAPHDAHVYRFPL